MLSPILIRKLPILTTARLRTLTLDCIVIFTYTIPDFKALAEASAHLNGE